MSLGTPKPPLLPSRAAKTVASTSPFASTAGPPELPCRTPPASAVIVALHRPVAVGVLRDHVAVRPSRPGTAVSGPFPG